MTHQKRFLRVRKRTGELMKYLKLSSQRFLLQRLTETSPLRALIFDSWFDGYQGVVILCRIIDGVLKKRDRIKFMDSGQDYEVLKLGVFSPFPQSLETLYSGEVGFVISGIKDIRDVRVGDTLTHLKRVNRREATEPLKGFQKVSPMVFSGIFPILSTDYEPLKNAMEKLSLNDSSLTYEPEKVNSPRLWPALWLSWSPAHGDRPREIGTRV